MSKSTPSSPIRCLIDSRLPGTGTPVQFSAASPLLHHPFRNTADLFAALPEMQASLRTHQNGLLVGLCPYPSSAPDTPASLMLFGSRQENPPRPATPMDFRLRQPFSPDWTREGYIAGVSRVREYLAAGDAYQVNLAQRFSARHEGAPLHAFLALRDQFTPPHAAYLDLGDRQVLSLSPESFLEVQGRRVTTRPIKGTRARNPDPAIDRELAIGLRLHPKDRAENLMIVDLLRNDLGKVCLPGSVRTPELFCVESYRNVHHMVSTVTGILAPGMELADLLTATFPGGSITGTPKRRAMEIIAELEPHSRDVYCGSIFWLLPDGTFGSNITIRTFLARDGHIHGWAGAGIVHDSDPASEYDECMHKLHPLMLALEQLNA